MLADSHFHHLYAPQFLPLEAELCLSNGECLLLEVADNDYEREIGLMQRESLAIRTGMLFKFVPPRIVRFWMHKTFIPLDMIFMFNGYVVSIEHNVKVCSRIPCPIYGPDHVVDSVIELAAGEADRLKIFVGDFLSIK